MIKKELFLEIFLSSKDVALFENDLLSWHETARKAVVISLCGEKAYSALESLVKKVHWPVLEKIDNPHLDIYSRRYVESPILVKKFTNLIRKKKELRTKKRAHSEYRQVIYDLVSCYPAIFKFNERDKKYIERKAVLYEKALLARIKRERNKKSMMYGAFAIGAAAGGYATVKVINHFKKKVK